MDETSEKLRRYLLGSLPASEAEEIDLQIITDDSLSEALARAEHELVEDHLDKSLTLVEEELFQQNFLVSDERREMVGETSLLREYADKFAEPTATVSESPSSLLDKLRAIFARPVFAGFAVIALLLVAGLVWQVFLRETSTPTEREYAAMNQRDLANPSEYSSISLVMRNLRDSNSSSRQSMSNMTDTVLLRLALPSGDDAPAFKAIVSQGPNKVFSIPAVKSYQNPSGREVRLLLPRSAIEKGQYQIRLERPGSDSPLTYSVTTE